MIACIQSTQPTREARLAALAKAATPGPWRADASYPDDVVVWSGDDPRWVANVGNWSRQLPDPPPADTDRLRNAFEADAADAAFIAAADPQVIAAMAAVVGAARALNGQIAATEFRVPILEMAMGRANALRFTQLSVALCDALAAWDALEEAP